MQKCWSTSACSCWSVMLDNDNLKIKINKNWDSFLFINALLNNMGYQCCCCHIIWSSRAPLWQQLKWSGDMSIFVCSKSSNYIVKTKPKSPCNASIQEICGGRAIASSKLRPWLPWFWVEGGHCCGHGSFIVHNQYIDIDSFIDSIDIEGQVC